MEIINKNDITNDFLINYSQTDQCAGTHFLRPNAKRLFKSVF